MKTGKLKIRHRYISCLMLLSLLILCFGSCKDDKKDGSPEFDPSKPLVISKFIPEEGGFSTRMVIYGENFGSDISKIKVTIGGQNARVIGAEGESLYCIVPSKAYDGDIKVEIIDDEGEALAEAEADEIFIYKKKKLVTTFLGYANGKDDYKQYDGPFSDCGGFGGTSWLSFDPKNPDYLFFVGEQHPLRLVDFEKEYVSTLRSGISKARCITWTLDGEDMLVSNDQNNDNAIAQYAFTRESGFKSSNNLIVSRQCTSSAVHPVNGELYYTSITTGSLYRYDFETGDTVNKKGEFLFTIQEAGWEFYIMIHPSGDYAYLVVRNKHYILRTDYDWANKTFTTPYLICGNVGSSGWEDAVGKSARLNTPMQGAFIKNQDYVESGKNDIYDFYFCDRANHAVRILTPQGYVSTFAGRGSASMNQNKYGYVDGDLRLEARFWNPEGIVYDEKRDCIYIGDRENRRIRKIADEE